MSELKPGTICRIIATNSKDVTLTKNANKICSFQRVEQMPDNRPGFDHHCLALQEMHGFDHVTKERKILPAGSSFVTKREYLKPLGDEGPEESDLFGIPKDTESGKQLSNLMELLK